MSKIIHIAASSKAGGVPTYLRTIFRNLDEFDHFLAIPNDYLIGYLSFKGMVETFEYNPAKFSMSDFSRLLKLIRDNNIYCIHAHGKGALLTAILVKVFFISRKFVVVYTLHGYYNRFNSVKRWFYIIFENIAALLVDVVIAVSNSEAVIYKNDIFFGRTKVRVINNSIELFDIGQTISQNIVTKILQDHSFFKIVSFSRFNKQKDILTLIKIHQKFSSDIYIREGITCSLTIFGSINDQQYHDSVLEYIRREGVKNVFFFYDVEYASSYLKFYNVYLSASLWEGLPISLIEAMASKIPIVSTAVTGNIDLINPERGYLFNPEDVKTAVSNLFEIYYSSAKNSLSTKTEAAYNFYKQNFSISQFRNEYFKMYKMFLNDI